MQVKLYPDPENILSSTHDKGHTIYHNIKVNCVSFDPLLKALTISIIEL